MSRVQPNNTNESAEQPTELGKTARRLSNWAANLFVSGVILAAGLTFGRQVLIWWSDAPAAPEGAAVVGAEALGDPHSPHLLAFGDYPFLLERQSIAGDVAEVLKALRASCREAAQEVDAIERDAGPAETALLEQIAGTSPVESELGKWQVYQLEGPLPLVVAVAGLPGADGSEAERRVVSWGLAMPLGASDPANEAEWTLFTYSAGKSQTAATAKLPPLPPGARRTMLLTAQGESALLAFRGTAQPRDWMEFYDRYFQDNGFAAGRRRWQHSDNTWHARFSKSRQSWVDVQLALQQDGFVAGVLTVSSSQSDQLESSRR